MGGLGEVLELLHGARGRWRTARVTVREWRDHAREAEAFGRDRIRAGRTRHVGAYGGPLPAEHETVVRVWLEGDRVREEREDGGYAIRDGVSWWVWGPGIGAHRNEGDPRHASGVGEAALQLLDPAFLLAALELEPAGEAEAAGRQALRVLARDRRSTRDLLFFHLGLGADTYELLLDRERGVLLRHAALLDGEPFAVAEVVEAAFDETFPPETFRFELPTGERFRQRPDGATTLEAAAAAAPFTVLAVAEAPERWRLHVHASDDAVVLLYHSPDAAHQATLHETATGSPDRHDWIDWRRQGDVEVGAPESVAGAWVRVERDGTRVVLNSSDLGVDALLRLAAGLRPAPTEPPVLG